jgi:hypothetical protein
MTKTTIILGIVLIVMGVASWLLTGMTSVTALIPAFFGVIFLLLGLIAKRESRRKLSMHISIGIALLGFLGSFTGIIKVVTLLTGGEVVRPVASSMQALMALILLVYLIMGIKSFVDARKAQM